jgi:hypothetical protein
MTLHIYDELEQGSPEWHAARRGIVTASVVGKLIAINPPDALSVACPTCKAEAESPCLSAARKVPTPIKTIHEARTQAASNLPPVYGPADTDTARALTATLVAERIAGWTDPSYMNDDMWRGVLHEPIARDKYAEVNKVAVDEVGFLVRDDWGYQIGASPDGLVGEDGGIEVKCPRAKTHIRTIVEDEVPAIHVPQVQACLLVSGREWWDYVSFCAGLPMWTKRVYPDPKWQGAIVGAVAKFETTAAEMVAAYNQATEGLPLTERIDNELGLVF